MIQTGPLGPALGFGSPQPRESWDSASSPSCFSSERIQRKLQLGSLELTAWALLFCFFFFFSEYLLSFLTCSLSPSAGNYSVSLSPDSQRLHYIIQTVPFELWSENHTPPYPPRPTSPFLGAEGKTLKTPKTITLSCNFSRATVFLQCIFFISPEVWIFLGSVRAKSLQFCSTPCDPLDCSPPGSSIHGIIQARILEWVAISFSRFRTFWMSMLS